MNRSSRFSLRSAASALLVALAVAGCSRAPARPRVAGCNQSETIHFNAGSAGALPLGNAPIYSPEREMGYWDQECLDVEVYAGKTSLSAMQLLATGQVDAVFVGPAALLAAREQGVDAIAVYQVVYKNHFWIAVLPDSPVGKIADLKGKTVGVNSLGDNAIYLFRAMAIDAGLDSQHDISFLAVGNSMAALDALKKGTVQALGLWMDPYDVFKAAGTDLRIVHSPVEHSADWVTNICVTRKYARSKPRVVASFLRGVSKGIQFSRANPQAVVQIHWKLYPDTKPAGLTDATALDRGVVMLTNKLSIMGPVPGLSLGEMAPATVAEYMKFAHEYGIIKRPGSPSDVYTNEFIAEANNFDPAVIQQEAQVAKVN